MSPAGPIDGGKSRADTKAANTARALAAYRLASRVFNSRPRVAIILRRQPFCASTVPPNAAARVDRARRFVYAPLM